MKTKVPRRYWVYHDNRGVIAGPFKARKTAERRMAALINESYGQSLWLSVVETLA